MAEEKRSFYEVIYGVLDAETTVSGRQNSYIGTSDMRSISDAIP